MTVAPTPTLEPDTRQRILVVAAKLFAERGYAGTSVRDIAKELGIANPSIYYHFKSKEDLLVELLTEPMRRIEIAVLEAKRLTGEARTRRIIEGFLESLEVRGGLALTALSDDWKVLETHRQLAFGMGPHIADLLAETTAPDNRDLRIMMAIGAVNGIITGLKGTVDAETLARQLRDRREAIVDLILNILR